MRVKSKTTTTKVQEIKSKIESIVRTKYEKHPFLELINSENLKQVLQEYIAMSQAFPYIQAGSQKDLIFYFIDHNLDVTKDVEATSVVGNFLCWDETGGFNLTQTKGLSGLPETLKTKENFHSNLLKEDLISIFGYRLDPNYSELTKQYLYNLYHNFSSLDSKIRIAYMVAFENHAETMIKALWSKIAEICELSNKDSLKYFSTHVGGPDPAEEYHVQMTSNSINDFISDYDISSFLSLFEKAYFANYNWCRSICLASIY